MASRYCLVFSCTPRPALISVLGRSGTNQVQPQLSLNGSRSAQNQSQTMRAIRKTVTFTSRPRRERCLPMKSGTGLSLLISMQIFFLCKNVPYRRFLGELTKQTKSKEVEERPELEIMAKNHHSGNKNLFSPSYMDDQTLYIRVFSGIQWSSDVICC